MQNLKKKLLTNRGQTEALTKSAAISSAHRKPPSVTTSDLSSTT
jgi:hypothetical protein